LQREAIRSVEPSIHDGERLTHKVYNILKILQCKKVSKSPVSKMLKKIDEDNEGTNQMSVSESEDAENTKNAEKLSWHREKNTTNESSDILG